PATFTTNGAAADEDGNIMLSSASNADNYFKVNPSTLEATIVKGGKEMYNVSDLANANLVYQSRGLNNLTQLSTTKSDVSVYPNPAVNKNFNVDFSKLTIGNYSLTLTDVNGKVVMTKSIAAGAVTEKVTMSKATGAGIYMLKVIDATGKTVHTDRVVIQ
ncbi:MAG: T9SS type A sorting domain-containing protein, partial [Chitinophagaceae bacterium]